MNPFPPEITDIHTHDSGAPDTAIFCADPSAPLPSAPHYLSIGLHPWQTDDPDARALVERVGMLAQSDRVLAIGESGFDALRGASLDVQEELFRRQVEISEALRKPMIIHCVRAFDRLLHVRRDMRPQQLWIVHGFRGKPQLARQLAGAGIGISFGERFNPQSVTAVQDRYLYYETDESALGIDEIRRRVSESAGTDLRSSL